MPSLYDITNAFVELKVFLESDELTPEQETQANEWLDRLLTGLLPDKVEGYCKLIKSLEGDAKAHAEEKKRIAERQSAIENKVKSLKTRLEFALLATDTRKLKAGTFTCAIQNNPASVQIDDLEAIPDCYAVVEKTPNKAAIKGALQAGEVVPGASLKQTEGLRIR
jgi:hypothetical protein